MRERDDSITFDDLPDADPFLLTARPVTAEQALAADRRPSCRILAASRGIIARTPAEDVDRLAYELAVAENLLILNPANVTAGAYLEVLTAARPFLADREVTR